MGKWTHLRHSLPAAPDMGSHVDKLMARTDELRGRPLTELTTLYNEADDAKSKNASEVKRLDREMDALTRAINDGLEAQNLDSVVANGYRWSPSVEPYPNVVDRTKLLAWAMKNLPDNLQVPPSTLKAEVKSALEKGEKLPDGVDVFVKVKLHRRKSA